MQIKRINLLRYRIVRKNYYKVKLYQIRSSKRLKKNYKKLKKNFQKLEKPIDEPKMGNFIDKTFTVIADILLKVFPASKNEKTAFSYYRAGMNAQAKGMFNTALNNYFYSLDHEEDPYDRGYTLYNIALVLSNIGKYNLSINFYHQAIASNSNLPQAFYNLGVIYHSQALTAQCSNDDDIYELSFELFDKAAAYWNQALKLAPDNYPGARNWLKVTGRLDDELK